MTLAARVGIYMNVPGLMQCSTQWRSDIAIVAVDTLTGHVSRVTPQPPGCGSWQLLVRDTVLY